MPADEPVKVDVDLIDPFSCRMWECHDRLPELINQETCREIIESFIRDGQKHPVLARPIKGVDGIKYELIYGARRLFAAQHLNVKLLARIRAIDNPTAFVEMDVESRLRRDISPYERGMSFKAWLRGGYFSSQEEIARSLGLSTAHVSRLMKFSELPTVIVTAFPDPKQIKESWAVTLAERCNDPHVKERMLATARSIKHSPDPIDAKQAYRRLLEAKERAGPRIDVRDEIVRSAGGTPLFRISYRYNDLHVIIRRDLAPTCVVKELTDAVRLVLSRTPVEHQARTTNGRERNAVGGRVDVPGKPKALAR